MDMESGRQRPIAALQKYRYVLLIVLIGVFLMLIPQPREEPPVSVPEEQTAQPDLETELALILSRISGVGKAAVLLTEASGSDTVYQTDTAQNRGNQDTVIVTDENREEKGLVKQVLPPVYRGAVVVCQGADSASVRLNVVAAVKSVTGLSADRITVLKMK